MTRLLLILFALGAAPVPLAFASPVSVQVLRADGQPLAGAVVTLTLPGTPAPAPRGSYTMAQRNIAFDPHVLIVPVGATVAFPNLDRVRHHIYSFSQPKRFELKLFGQEAARTVTFDRPGVVAIGCNIHDAMNAVVYVTASPYAAVADGDGRVQFDVARGGTGTVTVWHPTLRAAGNLLAQPFAVTGPRTATTLRLRK